MRVAVVGAGLAGLAAADALAAAGTSRSCSRPATGSAAGSTRASSTTARSSRWAPSSSCPAAPRCSRSRDALRPRPLGQGHALRQARSARRRGAGGGDGGRGRRRSTRRWPRGAGEGLSVRGLLAASTSITAPARRSSPAPRSPAAADGDLVPAHELGAARPGQRPAGAGHRRRQPAARRGARRRGRARVDPPRLAGPVAIAAAEGGVAVRPTPARSTADACVVAVPASVDRRDRVRPALARRAPRRSAAIAYGHAAKLFVPLPGPVPVSATLAVPDRYWAWTASGDDAAASQPLVSAFAGSPAALERPRGRGRPGTLGGEARRRSAPTSRSTRAGPCSRPGTTTPGSAPPTRSTTPAGRRRAARRRHGRIAFAGEHLGGEMSALMEGAIRSGRRAAPRSLAAT